MIRLVYCITDPLRSGGSRVRSEFTETIYTNRQQATRDIA